MKTALVRWLLPRQPEPACEICGDSPVTVIDSVVCSCFPEQESGGRQQVKSRTQALKKTVALYAAMVLVSTCAIYFLEHATILNAFRTALVAAVGKTVAATWVSSWFD